MRIANSGSNQPWKTARGVGDDRRRRGRQVAGEPDEARRHGERADAVARPAVADDQAGRDHRPADREVREDEGGAALRGQGQLVGRERPGDEGNEPDEGQDEPPARRRPIHQRAAPFAPARRKERAQPLAVEIVLGDVADGRARRDPVRVGRPVAARDQDDIGRTGAGQPFGDLEPVEVRQPDVEQDEVRPEPRGRGHGRRAIGRLADHGPAFRFEQAARRRAKPRVVVDEQDPAGRHDGVRLPRPRVESFEPFLVFGIVGLDEERPQPVAIAPPAVRARAHVRRPRRRDRDRLAIGRVRAADREGIEPLAVEGDRDLGEPAVGAEGPDDPHAVAARVVHFLAERSEREPGVGRAARRRRGRPLQPATSTATTAATSQTALRLRQARGGRTDIGRSCAAGTVDRLDPRPRPNDTKRPAAFHRCQHRDASGASRDGTRVVAREPSRARSSDRSQRRAAHMSRRHRSIHPFAGVAALAISGAIAGCSAGTPAASTAPSAAATTAAADDHAGPLDQHRPPRRHRHRRRPDDAHPVRRTDRRRASRP